MPARFELPSDHPHVAVVTVDRPAQANSLDPPTLRELAAAWRRIAEDPEIRCAVLTGEGDRVFCSGMDMRTTIPLSQRFARGERNEPEGLLPRHHGDGENGCHARLAGPAPLFYGVCRQVGKQVVHYNVLAA